MQELFCQNCGGELAQHSIAGTLKCKNCGAVYTNEYAEREKEFLGKVLDESKQDLLRNLRQRLWEQIDRQYIDSDAIVGICREIKNLYPNDFYANYYEVANNGTNAEINAFLDGVNAIADYGKVQNVVRFALRSLTAEMVMPLSNLVARTYRESDHALYMDYTKQIMAESKKVNEGFYDSNIQRDVFIAYANEDAPRALQLMLALEEQAGVTCFTSSRNIQTGRDSLKKSKAAIEAAISNCNMFVFVSSQNSRKICDVLRNQVIYLKNDDMNKVPAEYKQTPYDKIPLGYKKLRVQYRLDDVAVNPVAENNVNMIFAGTQPCASLDEVVNVVAEQALNGFVVETPKNEQIDALQKQMDAQFEAVKKAQEEEAQRQREAEMRRQREEEERRKREEMIISRLDQLNSLNPAMLQQRASAFQQQLAATPNDTQMNASLGFVYLKLGLYEKALEVFEKAMFTQSNNPEVYFWAGVCKLNGKKAFLTPRKDIDKAEEYVNAALRLSQKGIYYYFMAYLRYDYHERKYLKMNPNYVAYFNAAKKCGVTLGEVNNLYAIMGVQRPSVL